MSIRTAVLDEAGDLAAPPGTRDWAVAVRLQIQSLLKDSESSARHLDTWRKAMEKYEGWRTLINEDGKPFASYADFCKAKQPWGLGHDPVMIDRLIGERKTAQERHATTRTLNTNGTNQYTNTQDIDGYVDNMPIKPGYTNADYLTARIKRDFPDIAERMAAGEYRSVRQAALEAGIVKPVVQVPAEPERAARALLRHFNADELREIVELVLSALEE